MSFPGDVPRYGERFGTSPVSNAYFKLMALNETEQPLADTLSALVNHKLMEDQDRMIRDMLISSAAKMEEVPFEEFEGIAIDMSGPDPIYSKGWREFFEWNKND